MRLVGHMAALNRLAKHAPSSLDSCGEDLTKFALDDVILTSSEGADEKVCYVAASRRWNITELISF